MNTRNHSTIHPPAVTSSRATCARASSANGAASRFSSTRSPTSITRFAQRVVARARASSTSRSSREARTASGTCASIERARIHAVRESPGLSANTLMLIGAPDDPPLAVVRYTQRQRGAFENIRFVLDEAIAGSRRDAGVDRRTPTMSTPTRSRVPCATRRRSCAADASRA